MKKLNYSFALAIAKKKNRKSSASVVRKANINAICKEVDGTYVAVIHNGLEEQYALPFTPESFDLRGRTKVFGINGDDKVYLRTEDHAKWFPGLDTQYCSLRNGYDIVGDIVTINKNRYFNLKNVLNLHKDE